MDSKIALSINTILTFQNQSNENTIFSLDGND